MTDHLEKKKLLSVIFWAKCGVFISQGVGLVNTIVLARLLAPSEFGLIGMVAVFMTMGNVFANCGLGGALVQKNNITSTDASTVFWVNLFLSGFIYTVLFMLAGPIANFFGYPILKSIVRWLGLAVIFNAIGIVQGAHAQIQLRFRETTLFRGAASVIGTGIAIYMASHGYGVWTLVTYTLLIALITNFLLIIFIRWKPILSFSWTAFKDLIGYGGALLFVNFLDQAAGNIHGAVIGKFYPANAVGFFTKAKGLERLPSDFFSTSIQKVSFAFFSKEKSSKKNLQEHFVFIFKLTCCLAFPCFFWLIASAHWLVPLALGPHWDASIPLVQILAVGGMFTPLCLLNQNIIKSTRQVHRFIWLELFSKGIFLATLLISLLGGIPGIAIGYSVFMVINYGIYAWAARDLSDCSLWQQLLHGKKYFCFAAIVGGITWEMGQILTPWQAFFGTPFTCVMFYGLMLWLSSDFFGRQLPTAIWKQLREKMRRKSCKS